MFNAILGTGASAGPVSSYDLFLILSEPLYIVASAGILALIFAFVRSQTVNKADAGTERMQTIAGHIREGAMAFLYREYRTLAIFVVVVAVWQ